jgi:UrcA family protein
MEEEPMKSLAKIIAALALAGTAFSPAYAAPTEKMTIQVEYGDINLASVEGQKQLDRRLEKAVRTVCRTQSHNGGSRILNLDAKACLAKARADVRQQVAAITSVKQRGA